MKKVVLALGSNVGNRRENLIRALVALEDAVGVFARSKIYETPPWGFENQRDFLNAAVAGETDCEPLELLEFCKRAEAKLGRVKTVENGPRTIDIDIIFYGSDEHCESALTIPHPRWRERDFVLSPLLDLVDSGVFDCDDLICYKDSIREFRRAFLPFSTF